MLSPRHRWKISPTKAIVENPWPYAIAPVWADMSRSGQRMHGNLEAVGIGFGLVFGAVAVVLAADDRGFASSVVDRFRVQRRREEGIDTGRRVGRRDVVRDVWWGDQQYAVGHLTV